MLLNATIYFTDTSDTTIQFMNNYNVQYYTWTFKKQPSVFRFDMNNNIVLKEGTTVVGLIDRQAGNDKFYMWQNVPNPASNNTRIIYQLSESMPVRLEIMNLTGKVMMIPVNGIKPSGKYSVDVNCSLLSPGMYYYRLIAGNYSTTKK